MLISSASTASMGKFDKRISGEPKVRGVKRKFESNVSGEGWDGEKKAALEVLAGVGKGKRDGEKSKRAAGGKGEGDEGGLNIRKAVRFSGREDRARGAGIGRRRGRGRGGGGERGRGRGRSK